MVFKNGLFNYLTAVAPSDFFTVNIVASDQEAQVIAQKAKNGQQINGINDGFKGLFKVTSVREKTSIDPETGKKTQNVAIQGFGMAELATKIYLISQYFSQGEVAANQILSTPFWKDLNTLIDPKNPNQVQIIVRILFEGLCGNGVSQDATQFKNEGVRSGNVPLKIPSMVLNLMGVSTTEATSNVIDLYRFLLGVQKYENTSLNNTFETIPSNVGFFPSNFFEFSQKTVSSNNNRTLKNTWIPTENEYCEGTSILVGDFWNDIRVDQIMQHFVNSPINEFYTCFRMDKDGNVMPTVVMRQTPFSSDSYKVEPYTPFSSLPRWRIDPSLIYEIDLGRDDASRVNFVQLWSTAAGTGQGAQEGYRSQQILYNHAEDIADIERNGLRTYIKETPFDTADPKSNGVIYVKKWVALLADQVIGAHLKMSGSIVCEGIYDPICIGDNLQLDSYDAFGNAFSTIYHIESISHDAQQQPDGTVSFKTIISVSNGVIDLISGAVSSEMKYAEMENETTTTHQENQNVGIDPVISTESSSVYGTISKPLSNYDEYDFTSNEFDLGFSEQFGNLSSLNGSETKEKPSPAINQVQHDIIDRNKS